MSDLGIEQRVTTLLSNMNDTGGYDMALVCTDQGLLVAAAGDHVTSEEIAGFTSLFEDIVVRAERDLAVQRVDEVTLLDPGRGRFVIRPLQLDGPTRLYLVVRVPHRATWRRNTNTSCRELGEILGELASGGSP